MARDRDVFDAMFDAIDASGFFPCILKYQDLTKRPGDEATVVAVRRLDWDKREIGDGSQVRTVRYQALISHIDDDPELRFVALDQLENAFLNVADGVSIGSITLPQWTYCGKGSDDQRVSPPEGRVVLSGSFAYLIDDWAANDTAD